MKRQKRNNNKEETISGRGRKKSFGNSLLVKEGRFYFMNKSIKSIYYMGLNKAQFLKGEACRKFKRGISADSGYRSRKISLEKKSNIKYLPSPKESGRNKSIELIFVYINKHSRQKLKNNIKKYHKYYYKNRKISSTKKENTITETEIPVIDLDDDEEEEEEENKESSSTTSTAINDNDNLNLNSLSNTFQICLFEFEKNDSMKVLYKNFLSLNPGVYLDDTVCNFYLKYISKYFSKNHSAYIYNTFFYSVMEKSESKNMDVSFSKLKPRKPGRLNIFDYDHLLMPIFQNHHWSLILISSPRKIFNLDSSNSPIIFYFDSFYHSNEKVIQIVKKYLMSEYFISKNVFDKNKLLNFQMGNYKLIKDFTPAVPMQTNGYDCGIYMLTYIEMLLLKESSIDDILKKYINHTLNLKNWFDISVVENKRKEMQQLLLQIRKTKEQAMYDYTEEHRKNLEVYS